MRSADTILTIMRSMPGRPPQYLSNASRPPSVRDRGSRNGTGRSRSGDGRRPAEKIRVLPGRVLRDERDAPRLEGVPRRLREAHDPWRESSGSRWTRRLRTTTPTSRIGRPGPDLVHRERDVLRAQGHAVVPKALLRAKVEGRGLPVGRKLPRTRDHRNVAALGVVGDESVGDHHREAARRVQVGVPDERRQRRRVAVERDADVAVVPLRMTGARGRGPTRPRRRSPRGRRGSLMASARVPPNALPGRVGRLEGPRFALPGPGAGNRKVSRVLSHTPSTRTAVRTGRVHPRSRRDASPARARLQ